MNIKLFKVNGRKYAFSVNNRDGKGDHTSAFLAKRIQPIQPTYPYAWEAYRHASKLVTDWNFHLDVIAEYEGHPVEVSAEETLVDHYEASYRAIVKDVKRSRGNEEDSDVSYNTLKIMLAELETIVKQWPEEDKQKSAKEIKRLSDVLNATKTLKLKYFPHKVDEDKEEVIAKKEAIMNYVFAKQQTTEMSPSLREDLLEDYAVKISSVLVNYHPTVIYKIDEDVGEIVFCEAAPDTPCILKVRVNDRFHIDSIIPAGDTYKVYPAHGVEFYQKYWKPIVEAIGHYFIQDADTLIVPGKVVLPDIPKDLPLTADLEGWDVSSNSPKEVSLSFKGDKDYSLWIFEATKTKKLATTEIREVSHYTEQDYLNGIFKCIDPQLKSIYEQTGAVIQVIPHTDFLEVDIDFGRGIGVVRLTEDKVEKVL